MVANCMLTVLLWKYSWKGIVVDVVGRVMTTRYNKNVLVACTNRWARTNRHRALSSWVLLVRRHIMLRFWAEQVFHWHLDTVFRRLELVKDEGAVSISGGLQTPYHFRVLFGAAIWLSVYGFTGSLTRKVWFQSTLTPICSDPRRADADRQIMANPEIFNEHMQWGWDDWKGVYEP